MNGNVFQCHGENTDKQQFLKTVGVLGEHIDKTFTYPQDVASVCKSFKVTKLEMPKDLTPEDYKVMGKRMVWEGSIKSYMKRSDYIDSNLRAIYAIVWGQCSPMMQSKLESLENYETKSTAGDCVWLLKEIQGITHRFEGTRNIFISLDDGWSDYYSFRQEQNQTLHDYLKNFQSRVQVLEHYGAVFGVSGPGIAPILDEASAALPKGSTVSMMVTKAVSIAKKRSLAIRFLKKADRKRYGGLWSDLENQFSRGQDHYPEDLTAAYNLLLNYKPPLCFATWSAKQRRD